MSDPMIRRSVGVEEFPQLIAVWRSAVDATHHFLADEHRDDIESHLAGDYFPAADLFVAERDGVPVGFAGVGRPDGEAEPDGGQTNAGNSLEMLFIDARARGTGVGTALLRHVVYVCGVTAVDVNEQNEQAVEFYLRRGFVVVSCSEKDGQGRPYPLLHMRVQDN